MSIGKGRKRGSRRADWRTPQQAAADRAARHAAALLWVAEQRAARLTQNGASTAAVEIARKRAPATAEPSPQERALFAAAIARAEFGRHYWNGEPKQQPQRRTDAGAADRSK